MHKKSPAVRSFGFYWFNQDSKEKIKSFVEIQLMEIDEVIFAVTFIS
jgi:hypothetical protein